MRSSTLKLELLNNMEVLKATMGRWAASYPDNPICKKERAVAAPFGPNMGGDTVKTFLNKIMGCEGGPPRLQDVPAGSSYSSTVSSISLLFVCIWILDAV